MAKNKTTVTDSSVEEFINNVADPKKRIDSLRAIEIYRNITGHNPKMWGPSIIGFGSYHYKYESGHEGDAPIGGFSPRKDSLVFYFTPEPEIRKPLLEKLGKHKTGKSCVYVKKLDDIDLAVLDELIESTVEYVRKRYTVTSDE